MNKISKQDRIALIRLASSLPKGDENRRAILAGLKKASYKNVTLRVDRNMVTIAVNDRTLDSVDLLDLRDELGDMVAGEDVPGAIYEILEKDLKRGGDNYDLSWSNRNGWTYKGMDEDEAATELGWR